MISDEATNASRFVEFEATRLLPLRATPFDQSDRCFRALIEHSVDAISLTDAHGQIVYANASTAKVLGYEPQELLGWKHDKLIHPHDIELVSGIRQQSCAGVRCSTPVAARVHRKDGRWYWVEFTICNLLDEPDVHAMVVFLRDIHRLKRTEQRQLREIEELARSNAELQTFAYALAHDLREPLRTISIFTELLPRTIPLDDDAKECAQFIVDAVEQMATLLDSLLSLMGLKSDHPPNRVPLDHVLQQAIRNLGRALNDGAVTVTADPLPRVQGNESHLIELFQNLISNAIKYRSEARACEIRVTAKPLGREWMIKVEDNGIGIEAQFQDQIFDLFKRLHGREISGSGIGLAICKRIVEHMGGKIWVESEPQKGSAFCFTVPALEFES
jgi:PAS domain S-box-containing protein